MATKKLKGLGRGLEALLGPTVAERAPARRSISPSRAAEFSSRSRGSANFSFTAATAFSLAAGVFLLASASA